MAPIRVLRVEQRTGNLRKMVGHLNRDLGKAMQVVEAAHAETADLDAWMAGIVEPLRALLPQAVHGTALLLERRHQDFVIHGAVAPGMYAGLVPQMDRSALELFDAFFSSTYATTESNLRVDAVNLIPADFHRAYRQAAEGPDALVLIARVDEHHLALTVSCASMLELAKPELRLLTRLALHVEAALELRQHPTRERLLLRPDGKVLHRLAGASALVDEELRRHVQRVEGVRSYRRRKTPEALPIWTALVQGRFGLVERTDTDGQRYYVVVERALSPSRVLSPVEKRSIELAARGLSGKLIAYSQGVSEASVSHALARAAFKLGCRSRAELVRVASGLVSSNPGLSGIENLSAAEREVLELLRQGRANAEIASKRGTSVRTVANQVSSVLQKTGLPSRRALQVSSSPRGAAER